MRDRGAFCVAWMSVQDFDDEHSVLRRFALVGAYLEASGVALVRPGELFTMGATVSDDEAAGVAEQISVPCAPDRVGSFRYWFDTDLWEWSAEVAAMHGYRPGEVTPTTDLLRGHTDPEDRAEFDRLLETLHATRSHFSSQHRIVDSSGTVHPVTVVGRTFTGLDGTVAGSEGFYLDLGESGDPGDRGAIRDQVSEQVQVFRDHHASIEQAKGMLMLVYRIDEERAFDVLRWRSQQENRKLHTIARAIVDAAAGRTEIPDDMRREFDLVVLAPFAD
ncbi:MAG: PAS and ANTAR domain-containing protein [Gordonia sp. (in: high G+C Gram-positive bacteria)]|uniref:PAS and ANTAR domain-containing protein n=1 Tax=Gordonia sp. (in: high G+C Gram-positive bacteria) TaxID=84139 RepID=UPI003BB559BD